MGLISSLSRCVRDNKLSRSLSTSRKPRRLDDDSNDLIKTTSNTLSLAPAESISSETATVRNDNDPVFPPESPHRKRLGPADLNLQSMLDNGHTLDVYNSRAARALSVPEYPVYKLDTTRAPREPTKRLQAPMEASEKGGGKTNVQRAVSKKDRGGKDYQNGLRSERGSFRRSMTGLLKKSCSFRMPRSRSKRIGPGDALSRWSDDSSSVAEEDRVQETTDQKWLEANGLMGRGREFGVRGGGYRRQAY